MQVRGCFYHLTQTTWRKVQQLDLVGLYKEDESFKLFCGLLDALALLPITDVQDDFEWLKKTSLMVLSPLWITLAKHMSPVHCVVLNQSRDESRNSHSKDTCIVFSQHLECSPVNSGQRTTYKQTMRGLGQIIKLDECPSNRVPEDSGLPNRYVVCMLTYRSLYTTYVKMEHLAPRALSSS